MKASAAPSLIAELTASQWGLVTTAQAAQLGVGRAALARMATTGQLVRLAHGVYRDAGAPSDQFEDLRAAWLSTDPKLTAFERVKQRPSGVVIAGASAARLHGIGDLREDRHDFVTSQRRQSQRREIRYRQRDLGPRDVTIVEGLPVMTPERTIADVVEEIGDLSIAADVLRDASRSGQLDYEQLEQLLAPLAARNGLDREDGGALLDQLMRVAGIDVESVARRIAADPVLGPQTAARIAQLIVNSDSHARAAEAVKELSRLIPAPSARPSAESLATMNAAITRHISPETLDAIKTATLRATRDDR